MANFSAADVKRLRELTAAGMMDCKQALEEADGDFDRAIEVLRLKGAKDVGKREQRTASNGLIASHLVGGALGVLLELNCETDFVAKNDRFRALGERLAEHLATERPADVDAALESTADGTTVQELLDETNAALGEKVVLTRFVLFDSGYVTSYLHRTNPDIPPTIGVLLELSGEEADLARDIAQHIAAAAPQYITRDEVPQETVDGERRLAEQMARDEGKPERAIPKIIEGREAAYYKDFVLTEQPFVKDNKKTIGSVLDESGVTVQRFTRYRVGAG